ncbi:MAG: SDR family NAD(P)-dependent oxidoreductase [Candidatus Cyclobacteriaceae bacterium M2_1C_046]
MYISFLSVIFVVFVLLIIWEAYLSTKENLRLYHGPDTFANIFIATSSMAINLTVRGTVIVFFSWLYQPTVMHNTPVVLYWISLFLLCDFISYSFHYISHKSRFFWASHVIHHSSEHYNFTTAVRAPLTNFFYRFLFYAPLTLLGFEPLHILLVESIIYIYTFYLHTELVGSLGYLGYLFNTPSHHRVHHGTNHKYIDKNFGGILIIWDRIFGTFQKEEEKPIYGIKAGLKSYNPFVIIFHEWLNIYRDLKKSRSPVEAFKILFYPPQDEEQPQWCIITGGSAGIGLAMVRELALEGINLLIIALPDPKFQKQVMRFRAEFSIKVYFLELDLTLEETPELVHSFCIKHDIVPDILINNAGIGTNGYFEESDPSEIRQMIKLNSEALILLTYHLLPLLKTSKKAYILNVASMASFRPVPCRAVYSATKSLVLSFSRSLRDELKDFNIHVSCLMPGSTRTSERSLLNIESTPYSHNIFIQTPEQVAKTALLHLFQRKFMIIPGWHNHGIYWLWKILPAFLFQHLLNQVFKRKRMPEKNLLFTDNKQPRKILSA